MDNLNALLGGFADVITPVNLLVALLGVSSRVGLLLVMLCGVVVFRRLLTGGRPRRASGRGDD